MSRSRRGAGYKYAGVVERYRGRPVSQVELPGSGPRSAASLRACPMLERQHILNQHPLRCRLMVGNDVWSSKPATKYGRDLSSSAVSLAVSSL